MRTLIKYGILGVNLGLSLLLVLTYVSPFFNPGKTWIPSILSLAYPYLLVINFAFIIFWIIAKRINALIPLISIIIGIGVHQHYFQLTGRATDKAGIKVLSYNVHHFYSYLQDKDVAILDFIANQKADIICLQETKLQREGVLNPIKLKARFPGINHCQLAHASEWGGQVTFSKYPIVNMGEIRFENTFNMIIYTDIVKNRDTIRVYNCHLESFKIRPDDYSIIDSINFNKGEIVQVRQIASKLKHANIKRARQVLKLKAHIEQCPYSVIVCGDFNDTPLSFTYRKLDGILDDSFVESGTGIANSYLGKLPSFRIDYIFHSNTYSAYNFKRHKVAFSDHYPITTTLIKNE